MQYENWSDLHFCVPVQTYGLAETVHAAILHFWIDLLQANGKE